ncbi:MAG TPA: ATP-binding protein, partial [Verrucomicrobiae bacterium]|nr:ATP-binding protein [Verrucomicrobiae bacterium]
SGAVLIDEDISEFTKLQLQRRQAQKMESVGLLAGGVAHDFNNLLTAINGFAELLQEELQEADPFLRSAADQVLTAGRKAADLTRQLLAFSRKQTIDPKPHDINSTIREVTRLLGRIIGEDIRLATTLCDGPLTVMVDPAQFDQVLVNLATNARDAMPRGGELVIRTFVTEVEEAEAAELGLQVPGRHAVVGVRDTGCGIDPRNKARIFEPFFTTKGVGRGTGLGLSIIYGIVNQHNGAVRVESEPDRGSEFLIYLPLTGQESLAGGAAGASPAESGGGRVLVVEDDAIVRGYLATVLARGGYTVAEAASGEEALRLYRGPGYVDLLLTDVVMPGMNGKELVEEIRKRDPRVPVIFTSGYTRDIINRHGILDPGIEYLTKPVERLVLLRKVREVLSREN